MTTNQQVDINSLMSLMIMMMIIMMMMRMLSTVIKGIEKPLPPRLYPGGPRVGEFYRQPEPPAAEAISEAIEVTEEPEDELEVKRLALEAEGKKMARKTGKGVKFIGLEKGWQEKYATIVYRFKDTLSGEDFIARDVEEAQWKLGVIRKGK